MGYIDKVNKGICRKCLNEKYNAGLLPEDCKYLHYPMECSECHKVSNIVVDIRPAKRWKLWFKKEKTVTPTEM